MKKGRLSEILKGEKIAKFGNIGSASAKICKDSVFDRVAKIDLIGFHRGRTVFIIKSRRKDEGQRGEAKAVRQRGGEM